LEERIEELVSDCPLCGAEGSFTVRYVTRSLPVAGMTLVASGACSSCGFRTAWVVPLEQGEAKELKVEVSGEGGLGELLFVAGGAEVLVPELGLELKVVDEGAGFITTVEGVLVRFLETLEWLCSQEEAEEECAEKLSALREALSGRAKLTVVVRDESGRSALLPRSLPER